MTGTPAAATFFSLLAVLLIWLCWVHFGRSLRCDLLRWRLYLLRHELVVRCASNPPLQAGCVRLLDWIARSDRCAADISMTRVLLCAAWLGLNPGSRSKEPTVPEELAGLQNRLFEFVLGRAFHDRLWWRRADLLETVLASVEIRRGSAAFSGGKARSQGLP